MIQFCGKRSPKSGFKKKGQYLDGKKINKLNSW